MVLSGALHGAGLRITSIVIHVSCSQPDIQPATAATTVQGWNKKYDEWVEEVGCASENPESLIIPNKTKPKGGASHAGASKFDYAKPTVRSLRHTFANV